MRVLVVDDDDDVRQLLAISLPHRGIDVVGLAATHVAAVELAEQLQPDVVVTDLVAAFGHTEEDYIAALTLASPDSAVIVFSGRPRNPDAQLPDGVSAYVTKGSSLDHLMEVIDRRPSRRP